MIRRAILTGLAFGAGGVHLAVVGVLLAMHQRWIVVEVLTLGQAALLLLAGGAGAMMREKLAGLLAGATAAVPLAALTVAMARPLGIRPARRTGARPAGRAGGRSAP